MRTSSLFFKPAKCRYRSSKKAFFSTSHPIPQLKVLDKLVDLTKQMPEMPNLDKTAFIGVQHLLETTGTLFQSLIKIGVKPQNMFFSGKCYSTSSKVAKSMEEMGISIIHGSLPKYLGGYQAACKEDIKNLWQMFGEAADIQEIERVIIVDDGSRCIEAMPKFIPFCYDSASIEQTRGGLYSSSLDRLMLPLIEVASSAVKKHIESPFIAQAVLKGLKEILPSLKLTSKSICGIVGNGAIGNAIAQYLLELGYIVTVYDEDNSFYQNVISMPNIATLISNSTHVFGCTGKDITQNIDVFNIVENDITLISCTSEDREFLTLLKNVAKGGIYSGPHSDITCVSNSGHKITIMKSGFPINFDNEPWNVPAEYIAITQGLMFIACIQAACIAKKPLKGNKGIINRDRLMLNPYAQQRVLNEWITPEFAQFYPAELFNNFNNIEWIKTHSGGEYNPHSVLNNGFNLNTKVHIIHENYRLKR